LDFTGDDRLGLFLLAKNADVVVALPTGEGSRCGFFTAAFLTGVFLGLDLVSIEIYQIERFPQLTSLPPHLRSLR
jgi:hypothetical protein